MKLALVALLALTAPAFAKRDPACSCESKRVLPAADAVDVPTNARFWRLPAGEPGTPIQPYELALHTGFVIEGDSFTTGGGPDHEPPIAPSVAGASVTLVENAAHAPVATLHVIAATSADTAVVHLHFVDAAGVTDYYTTPDQLSVCEPGIALTRGRIRLEVSALDLAGNESPPDVTDLVTAIEPGPARQCSAIKTMQWEHDGPTDDEIGFTFLFALVGIGMFIYRANVRSRERATIAATPFALPAVAYVARMQRLRSLGVVTLAGIATSLALRDRAAAEYAAAASPFLATLVIDALLRYLDAGRVRVLLRYDGATADVQRDTVSVTVGGHRASLRASPRLVERARHHGIPTATL